MPEVRIDVYADTHGAPAKLNETTAALQGVDTQGGKANTGLGVLWTGMAIGTLAAQAVGKAIGVCTEFIKGSIGAAIEAEDAENNLRAALESTGRAVEPLAGHLLAYATELQKQTVYDDEAIMGAQALLVQLTTLDEKGLDEATRGAMGLASVFKMDLESAARLVAKGFEGNYTALGKMIPAVRDAKTESEKLAAMQNGLAQMYQRATAETGTFGGELKQLKNAFSDAQEKVGAAITGNKDLKEAIKGVTDEIRKLVENGQLETWISDAVTNITIFVDTVGQWGRAVSIADGIMRGSWLFRDVKSNMAEVIRKAKEEAVAFQAGLQVLKPSMDAIQQTMEQGPAVWKEWSDSVKATDAILAANKDTIIGWIDKGITFLGLTKDMGTSTDTLAEALKGLGVKIKTELTAELVNAEKALRLLKGSTEATPGAIKTLEDKIKTLKESLYGAKTETEKITETFTPMARGASFVRDVMQGFAGTLTTTFTPAARNMELVMATAPGVFDETGDAGSDLDLVFAAIGDTMRVSAATVKVACWNMQVDLLAMMGIIIPKIESLAPATQGTTQKMEGFFSGLYVDIAKGFGGCIASWGEDLLNFKSLFANMWDMIKTTFFTKIGQMVTGWLLDFITPAKKGVEEMAKGVGGSLDGIGGKVKGLGATIGEFISGIGAGIGGFISGLATGVGAAVLSIATAIGGAIVALATGIATAAGILVAALPDIMLIAAAALAIYAGFIVVKGLVDKIFGKKMDTGPMEYWLKLIWELQQNSYNFFIGPLTWKLDTIQAGVIEIMNTAWNINNGIGEAVKALYHISMRVDTSTGYLKTSMGYLKTIADKISSMSITSAAAGAVSFHPQLMMVHGTRSDPENIGRASQLGGLMSAGGPAGGRGGGGVVNVTMPIYLGTEKIDERMFRVANDRVEWLHSQYRHSNRLIPARSIGGA